MVVLTILHSMNEMDSLIQVQYSFAVSCWFLLPTANAVRLTDHPRLPGGLSNDFMLNTNIRNLSFYQLPKVKWFYGHSDKFCDFLLLHVIRTNEEDI